MTPHEFMEGWKYLVLQPWGEAYDNYYFTSTTSETANVQYHHYYQALKWVDRYIWKAIAKHYAGGSTWPELNEILSTLSRLLGHPFTFPT